MLRRRARNRPKRFDDPDFDFSGASGKPDGDRPAVYDTVVPALSQHSSDSVYDSEDSGTVSDSASNVNAGRVGATHSRGRKSTGSASRRRGAGGGPSIAGNSCDTVRRAVGRHVTPGGVLPRPASTPPAAASAHHPAAQLHAAASLAAHPLAAEPSAANSVTASPVPSLPPIGLSSSVAEAAEGAAARWGSRLQQRLQHQQPNEGGPLDMYQFQQGLSGGGMNAIWLESFGKDAAVEPQVWHLQGLWRKYEPICCVCLVQIIFPQSFS